MNADRSGSDHPSSGARSKVRSSQPSVGRAICRPLRALAASSRIASTTSPCGPATSSAAGSAARSRAGSAACSTARSATGSPAASAAGSPVAGPGVPVDSGEPLTLPWATLPEGAPTSAADGRARPAAEAAPASAAGGPAPPAEGIPASGAGGRAPA
jgi:hypothetical protein